MRRLALLAALLAALAGAARAESVADFYRGKQIRLVIGYPTGSGYNIYARLLADNLGRHMPGNPTIVPENMPGAGSVIAANYLYNLAPRDGTVIGAINRSVPLAPLLETVEAQNIRFDPRKFAWIGSLAHEVSIGFAWSGRGFDSFKDVQSREFLTGASSVASDGYVFGNMLNNLLGARLKIVMGYPDSASVFGAVERGELTGYFGGPLSSLMAERPDWLAQKKITVLIQVALEGDPLLPEVPLVASFARSEHDRQALALILAPQSAGRPYLAPPGLPEERLTALRQAFDATARDPALLTMAQRLKLDISPMGGTAIAALLERLYATSGDAVQAARDTLKASPEKRPN
jgi:tripartite-type tricarboxylate transporter receptor subunit TctC